MPFIRGQWIDEAPSGAPTLPIFNRNPNISSDPYSQNQARIDQRAAPGSQMNPITIGQNLAAGSTKPRVQDWRSVNINADEGVNIGPPPLPIGLGFGGPDIDVVRTYGNPPGPITTGTTLGNNPLDDIRDNDRTIDPPPDVVDTAPPPTNARSTEIPPLPQVGASGPAPNRNRVPRPGSQLTNSRNRGTRFFFK